ncbi:hypothetical protein B7463_g7800, partial [Scytalidium lignicola]
MIWIFLQLSMFKSLPGETQSILQCAQILCKQVEIRDPVRGSDEKSNGNSDETEKLVFDDECPLPAVKGKDHATVSMPKRLIPDLDLRLTVTISTLTHWRGTGQFFKLSDMQLSKES